MSPSQPPAGAWALRLSMFFGALFLIHGVLLTYLPVWLDGRGLSPTEIALASSAPMLLRLVLTPATAFAADRWHAHREMIILACVIGLGLMITLRATSSVVLVIALVVLMQVALQTIMPLADTLTMAAVKQRGLDYGRIRLWGSITFIVASYVAGFTVAALGSEAVLQLSMAGGLLTLAAALWLPRAVTATAARRLTLGEAAALLRDRPFLLFMVTVGTIQASHAMFYVFGVLHWRSQGLSAGYIATLWAIGVVAEIALFWSARWLAPLGPVQLITLGAMAGIVRWLAMAMDPAAWMLVPLQILHAGTFAATHLGAMHWIGARIPAATAGTAQAMLSTFTSGVVMSGVTFVSGPLYAAYSGGAYLAMMACCIVGLASGWALHRAETRTPMGVPGGAAPIPTVPPKQA